MKAYLYKKLLDLVIALLPKMQNFALDDLSQAIYEEQIKRIKNEIHS